MNIIRIAIVAAVALPGLAAAQVSGSATTGSSVSGGANPSVGNEIRAPRPGVDSTVGASAAGTVAGAGATSPGVDADTDRRTRARASGTGGSETPGLSSGPSAATETANKRAVDQLTPTDQPLSPATPTPTTPK